MINATADELSLIAKCYKSKLKPTHSDESLTDLLITAAEAGYFTSKWDAEKIVLSYEQVKELAEKGFNVIEIFIESPIQCGRKMFVGHEIVWGE